MGASVTASVVHIAGPQQQASTAAMTMFDSDNELAEFQSPKQRLSTLNPDLYLEPQALTCNILSSWESL